MIFQVFAFSFVISFFGTIPPATINVTVMQLSLKKRAAAGYYLSLGAVLADTFYAGLAVRIQQYLSEKVEFTNFFLLIAAIVLLVLGIASLRNKTKSHQVKIGELNDKRNGFANRLILGVLNPLAMPFWLAVTSYLQLNGWINLDHVNYWSYILGAFLGELVMLFIIVKLGSRFTKFADNTLIVNTIPGILFLLLAAVNFFQWGQYYF